MKKSFLATSHLSLEKVKASNHSKYKYEASFLDRNTNKTTITRFGSKGSEDYLMHKNPERRRAYIRRHEKDLRTNNPTRAGYLSYWLSWGPTTSMKENLAAYRQKLASNAFPRVSANSSPTSSSLSSRSRSKKDATNKGGGRGKSRSKSKSNSNKPSQKGSEKEGKKSTYKKNKNNKKTTSNGTSKSRSKSQSKKSKKSFVASIIFKRPTWTLKQAKKWIAGHSQYKDKVKLWRATKSKSSYRAILVHIPPSEKSKYLFRAKSTSREMSFLFAIPLT